MLLLLNPVKRQIVSYVEGRVYVVGDDGQADLLLQFEKWMIAATFSD